jgi:hypothetical protein
MNNILKPIPFSETLLSQKGIYSRHTPRPAKMSQYPLHHSQYHRVSSAMPNCNKDFFASPFKFMQKYAIAIPSDVEGYKGTTGGSIDASDTTGMMRTPTIQSDSIR